MTGAWVGAGDPLQAAGSPALGTVAQALTADLLQPIVVEAIALWEAAGLDARLADQLRSVDVRIADLSGNLLGLTLGTQIWIDANAAGFGWYSGLDPNGLNDAEMDLLTVVAHEMGHVLGLGDAEAGMSQALMAAELPAGVRREPSAADVDQVFADLDEEELFALVG